MFKEIENRDAWKTIRGFVYQVDLTIIRWINIKENELLELEKGEDIDIITKNIDGDEIERELEQVKHREANISLNNNTTIEILHNFYLHIKNNPNQKLLFRFITNTNYAIERPSIFIDGRSGIETWQKLTKTEFDSTNEDYCTLRNYLLKKIKKIRDEELSNNSQENQINQQNWIDFTNYLEIDKNLIEFIQNFEWSLKNANSKNISDEIKESLIELKHVASYQEAEFLYTRLFLFIFKLLCNKSLKVIGKKELLNEVSIPDLNGQDQATLLLLNKLLSENEKRIDNLEANISTVNDKISSLIDNVDQIHKIDNVFETRLRNIPVISPVLINNGTQRQQKVDNVIDLFNKYAWIHFQGINGTGKSQLAALLYYQYKNHWWLDLRSYNQDNEKTCVYFEYFLSKISEIPILSDRKNWLKQVLRKIPSDSIIILNDIPKLEIGLGLAETLQMIVSEIKSLSIHLLTTSNFKIPSSIISNLDEEVLNEYYDFDFSDDEIIEYFVKNGANETIAKFVKIISSISHRNPRIISAILHHLKTKNWGENSYDFFKLIFEKEFTGELFSDSQLAIKRFINDDASKELLYRLSLVQWNINSSLLKAVSNVEVPIQFPFEKIQDLLNIWIQEQYGTYQVSPIIYDIGLQNLAITVINDTYIAAARNLLSDRKIDPIKASRIILLYVKAKDYNNAGNILLKVLQSANNLSEVESLDNWGLLSYWSDIEIPSDMNIILRAMIRHEQIRLLLLRKKDYSFQLNQLKHYAASNNSFTEKVFIHIIMLSSAKLFNMEDYWISLSIIIDNWDAIDEQIRQSIDIKMLNDLLWFPIDSISLKSDLNEWLNFADKFKEKFQISIFSNEISESAIHIISNRIIEYEKSKLPNEINWNDAIETLQFLIRYFEKNNQEVLSVIPMAHIIIIKFIFLNQKDQAEENINELIPKLNHDVSKFILVEKIGRLYFDDKNFTKSKVWLEKALDMECSNTTAELKSFISAAASFVEESTLKASEYCNRAVSLVKEETEINELDYYSLLGEQGIAYWLNGDYENSFNVFVDLVNGLLEIKEREFGLKWIRLFLLTGHSLGYISAAVNNENVPTKLLTGDDYGVPFIGVFSFNNSDLSDLYDEKNDSVILAHLAIFAEGVHQIHKAYQWSLKSFDLARKHGNQKMLFLVTGVCTQYSVINYKVNEAFESYLFYAAVTSHLKGTNKEKYENLDKIDIADLLKDKPSKKWDIAEDGAITFAIIPLFIMIISNKINANDRIEINPEDFFNSILDYSESASNKELWKNVYDLTSKIINNQISIKELVEKSNFFGNNDLKNLQIICSLGIIYLTKDTIAQLSQIINIFPYISRSYYVSKSVIRFVLIPFVKNKCINILKDNYVGTIEELDLIIQQINEVDIYQNNSLQQIVRPIVEELEFEVNGEREEWLYESDS